MPPKLGSKKTRTGCFQCRERRIKCDEQKPRCKNCSRHEMTCKFPNPGVNATSRSGRLQSPAWIHDRPSPTPSAGEQAFEDSYGRLDLKLMHHYATTTCLAYSPVEETQNVWIHFIPEMAFKYEYLMKAILALSALHMAVKDQNPPTHLFEIARRHITDATTLARPHFAGINQEDCHALFAFSVCVTYWEFTSRRLERNADAITNFCEGIQMIKGCAAVVISCREWIHAGPMKPVLGMTGIASKSLPFRYSTHLDRLASYIANPSRHGAIDDIRQQCLDALRHLRTTYETILGSSLASEYNLAMRWPVNLPSEFMQLVLDRCPEALAVMAIYAPLMQDFYRNWFFGDWSEWLFKDIMVVLQGDQALCVMLEQAYRDLSALFYDSHDDHRGVPAHPA